MVHDNTVLRTVGIALVILVLVIATGGATLGAAERTAAHDTAPQMNTTTETNTTTTGTPMGNATNRTTIKLGGKIGGWQGMSPESINGTVNPTLNLTAGVNYSVTWVNLDGAPHNFVIKAANGTNLVRTKIMESQFTKQTVNFTATEPMDTYLCEVHPNSMVGSVTIGSNRTQSGNMTTATASPTTA